VVIMSIKKAKVISFFGGLVFVGAVVGIVLVKNRELREELARQTKSLVDAGKSLAEQIQFVGQRVQRINESLGERSKDVVQAEEDARLLRAQNNEQQWDELERANRQRRLEITQDDS